MELVYGGKIYDVEKVDYWVDFRNKAAIAAMQGMLSNPQAYLREGDTFPKAAVRFADALIKQLKEK